MDNPAPTIAESLAEFIARLDYASIPAAVRAQAKLHWLDSIGVALASSGFDFARKACAGLAALGRGEYPVIGMPARLALRDAVLMNGMLVHGIEFDDTSLLGRVHQERCRRSRMPDPPRAPQVRKRPLPLELA